MIFLLLQECWWVFSAFLVYARRSLGKISFMVVTVREPPFHLPLVPDNDTETVVDELKWIKGVEVECALCSPGMMEMESSQVPTRRGTPSIGRKRPPRLVLPDHQPPAMAVFGEMARKKANMNEEFKIQGRDYFLASKKGRRDAMEDGYGVIENISGNPKQAFFTVIDGHGGRTATDYVVETLGNNILRALESAQKDSTDSYDLEEAIRAGYRVTDDGFLRKGVTGGACVVSALLEAGKLHVANVGDCRVVLSRNGVAEVLTSDHRPSRDDERIRIENSGGFVHLRHGVWRVQGSLAVSRAIGDIHLKEWIISEPEIRNVPITSDCEFLIMASDGLWDKVSGQEAVDVVSRETSLDESCKKLVDISSCRGNLDDITVMVINLSGFRHGN